MEIIFKKIYQILGSIVVHPQSEKYCFKVKIEERSYCNIELNPKEFRLTAVYKANVKEETFKILSASTVVDVLYETEILKISSQMNEAVYKLLNMIKYSLNYWMIKEELFSVKSFYWAKNKDIWEEIPIFPRLTLEPPVSPQSLNKESALEIQNKLDRDFQPLLALKHLHRAKNESNPRYKWIDATIAAELAIKEFYIRLKPEMQTLLLEVPSPPLDKLYGKILESMIGRESPIKPKIRKGVEIRNKLIHRPTEISELNIDKAIEYVNDVEAAIYDLLKILYPEDLIVNEYFHPKYRLTASITINNNSI